MSASASSSPSISPPISKHDARPLIVFDDGKGTFGPLTDLRAAFELRAGVGTMLERIEAAVGRKASALIVNPNMAVVVGESTARMTNALPDGEEFLVVNGRLLSVDHAFAARGEVVVDAEGTLVCSSLARAAVLNLDCTALPAPKTVHAQLAKAPWDITSRIGTSLDEDLRMADPAGPLGASVNRQLRPDEGQSFGTHAIRIDPSASIGPLCVIDASKGPVIIGANVVLRPLCVVVGPCAVLEGSTVSERALLKGSTVIGPHCRAGGEIGGTIFQSYSNKSHDGHLGDSFVGEWVNIGAGTDNSNLLNTYGEIIVRLEADSGLLRTGRQFWGSILGDHAKLAIGTRLMTGTTVGTGAMIAQSRPPAALVARFSWLVDGGDAGRNEAPKSFRFDKFIETARAMMSRRGKSPSAAVQERLRTLHAKATGV